MARKILGIRSAVSDLKSTPYGFHQEVWGWETEKGDIQLYTSEYLSQNSWTINHPEGEHRLDCIMRELMDDDEDMSMTEALKRAVAQVFGE